VATHELLENAVRYAVDGATHVRIDVHREDAGTLVTIDTRNRAGEANRNSLASVVDEISSAGDPQACYQALMRRSAKRSDGSGLGLGRIRAESDMAISYRIEGDTVHLRAEARFGRTAA
jgi:hypothetical protein